ncbi:MAG: Uracil permease [candidate division WS2 bacterium]|uniref:Uracil permease n=1 Tax=Psychracetigena formicireducens TaxID=2986056 RepID=A0A9E2BEQ3_PSYF1|nr:Uracil permease [Candidatus Psychracetigena formicireducens]
MIKTAFVSLQLLVVAYSGIVFISTAMGVPTNLSLLGAGVSTFIMFFVGKGKVPVFMGVSFAYIALISSIRIELLTGGVAFAVMISAIAYFAMSFLIKLVGLYRIPKYFPPVVIGPIIVLVGLTLLPDISVKVSADLTLSLITILSIVALSYRKETRPYSLLLGIVVGVIAGFFRGNIDLTRFINAPMFSIPEFVYPTFQLRAFLWIIPGAIAAMIDHIGQVFAVSQVVEKDVFIEPGLSNTLLGNGIANLIVGLVGSPPVTPYGQITGSMALLDEKKTLPILIAAGLTILLAFSGKLEALVGAIPFSVLNSLLMVTVGLIIVLGFKIMITGDVDFSQAKNLIIPVVIIGLGLMPGGILVFGEGALEGTGVYFGGYKVSILALASFTGVLLNLLFVLLEDFIAKRGK